MVHTLRAHRFRRPRRDPPSAAFGHPPGPFGVRALHRLAEERAQSVGAMSPHTAADDDDGDEADEIAEGADQ
ncbi:hypothetical protein [Streptomyces alanosinicus]|uniref:hypothetical protein n=1 Tax=Streptomyces alanosinicus TaxID=68171 RepID=UPI0027E495AC|nr:hypothetical protein [Streptomyces alanosinicus]